MVVLLPMKSVKFLPNPAGARSEMTLAGTDLAGGPPFVICGVQRNVGCESGLLLFEGGCAVRFSRDSFTICCLSHTIPDIHGLIDILALVPDRHTNIAEMLIGPHQQ